MNTYNRHEQERRQTRTDGTHGGRVRTLSTAYQRTGVKSQGGRTQGTDQGIERQQRANPNDPAFTVLDDLEETSLAGTAETDARAEDDLVEEWNGDDVEFTLAENLGEHQ
jgi:hypothetical protein